MEKSGLAMLTALVAEDEMLIRELAVEDLGDAGFAVTAVRNGDEALAALDRAEAFDLLCTDIRMPGAIDGWELGARARARFPGLRILYVTGYSETRSALSPHERCIMKPYRRPDLLAALRSLGLPVTG